VSQLLLLQLRPLLLQLWTVSQLPCCNSRTLLQLWAQLLQLWALLLQLWIVSQLWALLLQLWTMPQLSCSTLNSVTTPLLQILFVVTLVCCYSYVIFVITLITKDLWSGSQEPESKAFVLRDFLKLCKVSWSDFYNCSEQSYPHYRHRPVFHLSILDVHMMI